MVRGAGNSNERNALVEWRLRTTKQRERHNMLDAAVCVLIDIAIQREYGPRISSLENNCDSKDQATRRL
jgi:hypothetical protein